MVGCLQSVNVVFCRPSVHVHVRQGGVKRSPSVLTRLGPQLYRRLGSFLQQKAGTSVAATKPAHLLFLPTMNHRRRGPAAPRSASLIDSRRSPAADL